MGEIKGSRRCQVVSVLVCWKIVEGWLKECFRECLSCRGWCGTRDAKYICLFDRKPDIEIVNMHTLIVLVCMCFFFWITNLRSSFLGIIFFFL